MRIMKILDSARPSFRLEMIKPRKAVDKVFDQFGTVAWLTSGTDGEHSAGSLHYSGYAEDFDGEKELSKTEWQEIEAEIREELNDSRYQIIAHAGHVHIEYDPAEFRRYK